MDEEACLGLGHRRLAMRDVIGESMRNMWSRIRHPEFLKYYLEEGHFRLQMVISLTQVKRLNRDRDPYFLNRTGFWNQLRANCKLCVELLVYIILMDRK